MRMSRVAFFALPLSLIGSLMGAGCNNTEFITAKGDEPDLRPVGEGCTLDAECDGGRCVNAVCSTNECSNDDDCRDDEICITFGAGTGTCEPRDTFACQTDQRPILSVRPSSVNFAQVALGTSETQIVTVENEGDCLLTLQVISFSSNTDPDFACSPCSAEFFPQNIPPRRSLDVEVTFSPTSAGEAAGELLLRSDDVTAGDGGLYSIPLFAEYDGIPALVASPQELNFGFVPFVVGGGGGSRTETVRVTNEGTGVAVLQLERIAMDDGDEFLVTAVRQGGAPVTVAAIDNETPLLVPPFNIDNPQAVVEIDITFTPNENDEFEDELELRAGGFSDTQRFTVPVIGSSRGPPQIEVLQTELVYGGPANLAMPVGGVGFEQVTVRNNGQSDLIFTPTISGGSASADFTVMPAFVNQRISAGSAIVLSVFYNPSEPSDPANTFSPSRAVEAALNITSNDTDPGSDVLKTVALRGFAASGVQDQVLKVEMEFENADNSWAGSDFRNVDLAISSVDGAVICTKPRIDDALGNGEDFCGDWNDVGTYGSANWLSLGAFEEPERVVVRGMGPNGANGEAFDIEVFYAEDCANIPSGLLSDILGIGASVLLGALGGAIGVPVAVPPSQISDTIANNCFDHASSQVTVRISLDGAVVASPGVRLGSKGDRATVATLRRVTGAYCSLTPGVGGPDLQCP